jgi:hypothetical protein
MVLPPSLMTMPLTDRPTIVRIRGVAGVCECLQKTLKFWSYAIVGDAESARGSDISDHLLSPSNRDVIEVDSEFG